MVDVIVASGPSAVRAAQKATNTIPIVFVLLSDPAVGGYVTSLARPGGNMTGLASQYEELITKQLQLLRRPCPRFLGSRFCISARARLRSSARQKRQRGASLLRRELSRSPKSTSSRASSRRRGASGSAPSTCYPVPSSTLTASV